MATLAINFPPRKMGAVERRLDFVEFLTIARELAFLPGTLALTRFVPKIKGCSQNLGHEKC